MGCFIFLFAWLSPYQTTAQFRQLRLADEELSKSNFSSKVVIEKIKKYEKENGLTAESKYVRSKYLRKTFNDLSVLDSAYQFFTDAYMDLEVYEDKIKERLCEDIKFCLADKFTEEREFELLLFNSYTKKQDIEIVEKFIDKYVSNYYYEKAKDFRDSLEVEKIKILNDDRAFQAFLDKRPYSKFYKVAQQYLYTIAFDKVKQTNSLEKYTEYIKKYPNSPYFQEAVDFASRKKWALIEPSNNRDSYVGFINDFPTCSFIDEVKQKVEDIDWNDAVGSDSLEKYEAFIANYSRSKRLDEAKLKVKEIKEMVLPFLTKNKKYALINTGTFQLISNTEYDKIAVVDKNRFAVSKYNKYGVIDAAGQNIIPLAFDCVERDGNYFIVKLGELYGVYNAEGQKIIDFTFNSITKTSNDFFIVSQVSQSKTLYGLISSAGEVLLENQYANIEYINNNTFLLTFNQQSYLADEYGTAKSQKYVSMSRLDYDDAVSEAYFRVQVKNKYGVINGRGDVVVPAIYEYISRADKYFIVTGKPAKGAALEGIADLSGHMLVEPTYRSISYLGKNLFSIAFTADQKASESIYRLFDVSALTFLTSDAYESISRNRPDDTLLQVFKNGKMGYIDESGQIVADAIYEGVYFGSGDGYDDEHDYDGIYDGCILQGESPAEVFSLDTASSASRIYTLGLNEKYGFIDSKGTLILPMIYVYVGEFEFGLAEVGDGNITNIIDKSGKVILEGASLHSFIHNGKFAIANNDESFYKIEVATGKVTDYTLIDGMEKIKHYKRYKIIKYKGETVFVTNKDQILMAKEIDFSDYEFKKNIEEARQLYYQKMYDEAINKLELLAGERSSNYDVHLLLGMCYAVQNDTYNAMRYFNNAIEIDGGNTEAYYQRYYLNAKNKNWYEVKNDLLAISNLKTDYDEWLTFNLGYAYQESGYNDDAFKCYTRVIKNNPKHVFAYNNRGVIYNNKGEYQLALNDYLSAMKNSKNESNESKGLFLSNIGETMYRLNRKVEACAYWNKGAEFGNENCSYALRTRCKKY